MPLWHAGRRALLAGRKGVRAPLEVNLPTLGSPHSITLSTETGAQGTDAAGGASAATIEKPTG